MYPCFCLLGEVVDALVVEGTFHHQMPVPTSVVRLVPLVGAPPLHHLILVLRMCGAPIRSHLQKNQVHDISEDKIKHIKYQY
jgi:hypothetical protein